MEDVVRVQAQRLRQQLAALAAGAPVSAEPDAIAVVEQAVLALRHALAALPSDARSHLTSAELGFMPGPALDAFVERHRQALDKQLHSLAQGAAAVQQWIGPQGLQARRAFLVRGYVRGFAHQWRQAGRGEPEASAGSPFYEFARDWLEFAGVHEVTPGLIAAALDPGWRVVAA